MDPRGTVQSYDEQQAAAKAAAPPPAPDAQPIAPAPQPMARPPPRPLRDQTVVIVGDSELEDYADDGYDYESSDESD